MSCTYRITILTHFFHEFQPWLSLYEWWSSLSLTFFLEKTEGLTTGSLSLSSQEPRGPLYLTWHRNWHWRNILSFTTNVEYTQNYGFQNMKLFKNMETYANTDTHIKPNRSELNNFQSTKIEVINHEWIYWYFTLEGFLMKNDTHLYGIGRCQFSYGLYRILYGYIAYTRIFTEITSCFFEPESRQNPMKWALFNMTPWISLTHPKDIRSSKLVLIMSSFFNSRSFIFANNWKVEFLIKMLFQ